MSEQQEDCDALEHSDDSSSCAALANEGPSASEQGGLYMVPGDDLSCGTNLSLPSAQLAGPLEDIFLLGCTKASVLGFANFLQATMNPMDITPHVCNQLLVSCRVTSTTILR